jgi:hypothetical protein
MKCLVVISSVFISGCIVIFDPLHNPYIGLPGSQSTITNQIVDSRANTEDLDLVELPESLEVRETNVGHAQISSQDSASHE